MGRFKIRIRDSRGKKSAKKRKLSEEEPPEAADEDDDAQKLPDLDLEDLMEPGTFSPHKPEEAEDKDTAAAEALLDMHEGGSLSDSPSDTAAAEALLDMQEVVSASESASEQQPEMPIDDPLSGEKVIKVVDKRSDRLGGHLNTLMNFLNNLTSVVDNAYIQESQGQISQCNMKFVKDVMESGEQLVAVGKEFIQKATKLEGAITKRKLELALAAKAKEIESQRNPSSESDTEEGQERERVEKAKKKKAELDAIKAQAAHDASVSGSVVVNISPDTGQKIRLYVCNLCQSTLSEKRMLEDHLQRHTGISLKCTSCDESFKSIIRFKGHIDYHQNGPFQCTRCDKTFKWRTSRRNHIDQVHGTPQVCKICNKSFKSRDRYRDHVEFKHTPGKNVQCHLCPKTCKTKGALRVHLSLHHKERDASGQRIA